MGRAIYFRQLRACNVCADFSFGILAVEETLTPDLLLFQQGEQQ